MRATVLDRSVIIVAKLGIWPGIAPLELRVRDLLERAVFHLTAPRVVESGRVAMSTALLLVDRGMGLVKMSVRRVVLVTAGNGPLARIEAVMIRGR